MVLSSGQRAPASDRSRLSAAGSPRTNNANTRTLASPPPGSTSDFGLGFPALPLVRGAGRTSDAATVSVAGQLTPGDMYQVSPGSTAVTRTCGASPASTVSNRT